MCTPTIVLYCGTTAGACEVWDIKIMGGRASLGSSNFLRFSKLNNASMGTGLVASYTGGDAGRSFKTYLICDKSIDRGFPQWLGELGNNSLTYAFLWKTKHACSWEKPTTTPTVTGGSIPIGWIISVVLLSLISIYCFGGALFNKIVFEKSGCNHKK